jgi:dTDP-4-amino-4,6-dideoxygalactose transaminase
MQWRVPLFDPDLGDPEIEAITAVIRSKWLTMGERTTEFEDRFARYCGANHAIATSNCTAALHLALLAVGVKPDDEVIVPSLTFVASANAIRYCGAIPIFADVSSHDEWNVCRETIEPLITNRSRAILVVHYAGYPCRMAGIMDLAHEKGLAVVEDVAHAPGASLDGRKLGTWGDAGCFSFFSNKNMTTAEGGMITTQRDDVAQRLRRLRSHGMTTLTLDRHKGHAFSYDVVDLGYNYRLSELNAALGLCQLSRLDQANLARAAHVKRYRARLSQVPNLAVPFSGRDQESSHHIMPVLLPEGADRDAVMSGMRAAGIQTSIHYRPVDTFSAYVQAGLGPCERLTLTHDIGRRTLTLPLYPSMREDQIDLVCDALGNALATQA